MKILKYLNFILVFAAAVGAILTYGLKSDSKDAVAKIHDLERRIAEEEQTIALLKAEWSVLSSPDRLARLAEHYNGILVLQPVAVEQIVTFGEIPEKPAEPETGEETGTAPARRIDRAALPGPVFR